ncbi:MAG: RNA methyltransferase [Mediterranea sp.]|jgi:TrmH family RNA methyltransferase|nr:RNA methyltransferase [Mediterranea sp.]
MTLSKARIRFIHSMERKKVRDEERLFLAEGPKLVGELLPHFDCRLLAGTAAYFGEHPDVTDNARIEEVAEITREELERASLLKTPQQVVALFGQPCHELSADYPLQGLCLALDDVQDPGNLGTIVRLADWFGIAHIVCSRGTADVYNPKTVQATMGALARVRVHYTDLSGYIDSLAKEVDVFGTCLDGENMYQLSLPGNGLIVMGNEGNGIGREIEKRVTRKLLIPSYPRGRATSESLNVATATAVVCAEFRRQAAWR